MTSKLVEHQTKVYGPKFYADGDDQLRIIATVRHDDNCGNGHNSFAITADITIKARNNRWVEYMGGCCHDEVARYLSKLAPFIKWHLCSTDGPMHYIANTIYHATEIPEKQNKWYFYLEGKLIKIVGIESKSKMVKKYGNNAVFTDYPNPMAKLVNIEAARHTAIWPEATPEQLQDKAALAARLPDLLADFERDVISLGLVY